jgi:hypothetical protein
MSAGVCGVATATIALLIANLAVESLLALHPEIALAASKLYRDGHYANAVEASVKALLVSSTPERTRH